MNLGELIQNKEELFSLNNLKTIVPVVLGGLVLMNLVTPDSAAQAQDLINIGFFGDSLTIGDGPNNPEITVAEIINTIIPELKLKGVFQVAVDGFVTGVRGATIENMCFGHGGIFNFEKDFAPLLPQLDTLVINLGTNNVHNPEQVPELLNQCINKIQPYLAKPDTPIIVSELYWAAVDLNDQIKNLETLHQNVHVVSSGNLDPSIHTTDGLHLNLEGALEAAKKLAEKLKRFFKL